MARPSKIHAQHTRSRPGLRIYTLSHLEFFISRKRKKIKIKHTDTLRLFFWALSIFIYSCHFLFSPFDVCIRMTTLLYICASQDFRNIGSLDSLSTSFASFSFVYGTGTAKTLCAVFLNPPLSWARAAPK